METKKAFKLFTIFQYKEEQDYLRKMHQSGWKFIKVSKLSVYHFEKCIPEDVIYQLDYNRDGIKNIDEYVKMFNDCGWEYLQCYTGYSYFRKSAAEAIGTEEIFCDNDSRLQMWVRVLKRRLSLLAILLLCLYVPLCIIVSLLINSLALGTCMAAVILGIVFLFYVITFIWFVI